MYPQVVVQVGRELKKVKAFLLQRLVKKCRKLREKEGGGAGKKIAEDDEDDEEEEDDDDDEEDKEDEKEEQQEKGSNGSNAESLAVSACLEEIKAIKVGR